MLNGSIWRQIEQPAPRVIGAIQGQGCTALKLQSVEGHPSSSTSGRVGPLPMLMDVSKQHRPQGPMGTQQLLKTCLIEEPDRIHAGITDGDRWMVKGSRRSEHRRRCASHWS